MVTMEYTDLTVRQMQERTQALQDKYGAEVLASAVMITLDEVYDTNRAVLAAVEEYCHEIHRRNLKKRRLRSQRRKVA